MTEPERESMEVDVLYVGAGPATLASAYHRMKQVEAHNEACEKSGETPIETPTMLIKVGRVTASRARSRGIGACAEVPPKRDGVPRRTARRPTAPSAPWSVRAKVGPKAGPG